MKWTGVLFLASVSVPDIRSKKIPLIMPILFGVIGISIQIFFWYSGKMDPAGTAAGLIPGALTAVLAACTEAVGMGDAICLLVLALFEGEGAVAVFLGGLVLLSLSGLILIAARRANRRTRLPFMPFLFAAQVLYCLICWKEGA